MRRQSSGYIPEAINGFDCTNVVHEVFIDYIPTGNIICFEQSETIRKFIDWVKTMKKNLKRDGQPESVETRGIASLLPFDAAKTLHHCFVILIKNEIYV
jgi:hypothetical protein